MAQELASRRSIRITAITRLKHTELLQAARSLGSQTALAKRLKVKQMTLSRWVNLKECPPKEPTRGWPAKRLRKLEKDLLKITGKLLDDLFPPGLRTNAAFLNAPKLMETTREVETYSLVTMAARFAERTTVDPPKMLERTERQLAIRQAIESLDRREAVILRARWGLNGDDPVTLQEIADEHGVSRERIRQLEARAIQQLRESPELADFAEC